MLYTLLVLLLYILSFLFVLLYIFFWPLFCLFFSSMNGFWLPRWYLLAIVLSVLLLFDIRILITPLISVGHCFVCSSLRYKDSDYPVGIFWPLCCLFFFSSMNGLWLPLWYLLAIVLSVLLLFDIRILITPLVSFGHCVFCSSLRWTDYDYPFGIFWPLCCLFVFSSMNGFWLPLWYLLAIVLSVLHLFDERILITPFYQQYLFRNKSKSDWEYVNGTLRDFGFFFVFFL